MAEAVNQRRRQALRELTGSYGWEVFEEVLRERVAQLKEQAMRALRAPEDERIAIEKEYAVLTRILGRTDYGLNNLTNGGSHAGHRGADAGDDGD